MTHTIYLVRHGVAADPEAGQPDADRALTTDGRRKMRQIGAGLKAIAVAPAVILTSPLRRTRETAEILRAELDPSLGVELCAALAPGHAPVDIVAELRPYRTHAEVMLVGHQPDMGELASYLLTGSEHPMPLPFKKGAVAAIVMSTLSGHTHGELEWFLTPKQLRALRTGD